MKDFYQKLIIRANIFLFLKDVKYLSYLTILLL